MYVYVYVNIYLCVSKPRVSDVRFCDGEHLYTGLGFDTVSSGTWSLTFQNNMVLLPSGENIKLGVAGKYKMVVTVYQTAWCHVLN